ncbi:uncharacterized protein CcaverHIS019_0509670 [Cutaneotrichosporon cavernicola]|uniref:Type 1 phosphatases regulator n=1 Tax=Cutaneotrichosporon cavernicola TaxID=279322 RepID=A0AA48L7D5_9TREE|nr:uncharacterized protein CcaverHIS019_0509670 [Cutaneotrichosporon cavernicola]BEI93339.1 hypothetical protein CcaverHIS019_0509670 [Cutaneotrichosporon cavernicola]BEJ08886.1 hypothetical protein CcaverHIS641_0509800 [Cutaneotrichosporon cavernicola]
MSTRSAAQTTRPENLGSRTMTITPTTDTDAGPSTVSPPPSGSETPSSVGVLRLRGAPGRRQRVVWTSDTVDNEGMGKKKSKICCIYHKPRAFDESSSESDSCDSDNDSCCGDGQGSGGRQQRPPQSHGGEVHEQSSDSESDGGGGDGRARPARKPRRKHSKHHDSKANKYDSKPKAPKEDSA